MISDRLMERGELVWLKRPEANGATGSDPAIGMLVMAPLSLPRYGSTTAREGRRRATRGLRRIGARR